jgi:hypothetical protein
MQKVLLIIGGILNTLFLLFHLLLGYQIHHLTQIAPSYRGLMEGLNAGGALFIFFFAYVSLFVQRELMNTNLGRVVLTLVATPFVSRSVEEFIWFRGNLAIFGTCLVTGGIYGVLLAMSLKKHAEPIVNRAAAA